jgi:Flp pilus assembly protein TadG
MRSSWYHNAARQLRNERGATFAIVGVSLVVLIGALALAVDLGMLYNARTESQRASDAAALAGASALVDYAAPEDSARAVERAVRFAGLNLMRGTAITPAEVESVELIRSNSRVRVRIRRPEVTTIFARIFGINSVPVGTTSVARRAASGTVGCLKPFAVPNHAFTSETFGGRVIVFDSRDDLYVLFVRDDDPPGGANYGPPIAQKCPERWLKVSLTNPWLNAKPSGVAPAGQVRGTTNPNNTTSGFNGMFNQDPHLTYNPADRNFYRNGVEDPNWRNSPRVGNVAVVNTNDFILNPNGTYQVRVSDFVTVFFEGCMEAGPQFGDPYCSKSENTWVYGRAFPAIGEPDDCERTNSCSPNLFRLRLVE